MEGEDEGNEALPMLGDGAYHRIRHRINEGRRF
jgi:hypothetical protein